MNIGFRCLVSAALGLSAAVAAAQGFPAKPVRAVVPWPPGAPLDTITRALSAELAQRWGQPVVVDNRAGAASIIGAEHVARSPADGHTWMVTPINPTVVGNRFLYKSLPYDPERSFEPVSLLAESPQVVVVHPAVEARTLSELVALMKQQPGKLNYGSYGDGSQPHLLFELFKKREGVQATHIAYKGIAPLTTAVMAGEVQFTAGGIGTLGSLIRAGKLRPLLVAGPQRIPELPDVPTAAESGQPYMQASARFGLFVPAGTPRGTVLKISEDVREVLSAPAFSAKHLTALGYQLVASTPEQLSKAIADEVLLTAEMIRAADIQPE